MMVDYLSFDVGNILIGNQMPLFNCFIKTVTIHSMPNIGADIYA